MSSTPEMPSTAVYKTQLRKLIGTYFDLSNVKTLCFDLGINYDDLSGDTEEDKVRELILHCERMSRVEELIQKCEAERPKINWRSQPAQIGGVFVSKVGNVLSVVNAKGETQQNVPVGLAGILVMGVLLALLLGGFAVVRSFSGNNAKVITENLGVSVGGRAIGMQRVGTGKRAIIIVGGLQGGEETETQQVVTELTDYYAKNANDVPQNISLYFVPNINPDGDANKTRLNANGVDLNRNWTTSNWEPNPTVVGTVRAGAGGAQPFSEPESRAVRDLILKMQRAGAQPLVVVLHSSTRANRSDINVGYKVVNGYVAEDSASIALAHKAEAVMGNFQYQLGSMLSGEVIGWCAEQDIASLDLFWSRQADGRASLRPSTGSLSRMLQTIAAK